MLAQQRQARILAELRRSGAVRVGDLTELLGVSDMTVRRDLEQLAADGHARKVHGGAVMAAQVAYEPGFAVKSQVGQPTKQAIAERAASLISPGAAIALSAGTTTWAMAPHIAAMSGLTVVTNSTTVADAIAALDVGNRISVILTGGVRTPSAALVGPVADRAIASMHVDLLFTGVHGMHPVAGFSTPNLAEAETNRKLIDSADRVIVCADSSKWGAIGLASFAGLDAADVLITDSGLPDDARAVLADAVGELHVVDVEGGEVPASG